MELESVKNVNTSFKNKICDSVVQIGKGYRAFTPDTLGSIPAGVTTFKRTIMKENGKIVKCPDCKSENIEPVTNFDYWKQCKNCGKEFMTGIHN